MKFSPSNRPLLYQHLLHLMSETEDLVVCTRFALQLRIEIVSVTMYNIYLNKRPGRLFNFWCFRVATYSRPYVIQKVHFSSTIQRRNNTDLTSYLVRMILGGRWWERVNFLATRVGAYPRWALMRAWTFIKSYWPLSESCTEQG